MSRTGKSTCSGGEGDALQDESSKHWAAGDGCVVPCGVMFPVSTRRKRWRVWKRQSKRKTLALMEGVNRGDEGHEWHCGTKSEAW